MKSYRGYSAVILFDEDALRFHGYVVGSEDMITFHSDTAAGLQEEFRNSIDIYLKWCEESGSTPKKSYSGNLAFRTSSETHEMLSRVSNMNGVSINEWMNDVLSTAAKKALQDGLQVVKTK